MSNFPENLSNNKLIVLRIKFQFSVLLLANVAANVPENFDIE